MTTIIDVTNLSKSYNRGNLVLEGLDLSIQAEERVALIGSNGSGKSTLLKCLIGLHPVSGGQVKTLGESFAHLPNSLQRKRMRRQTGFVFQNHCLVKRHTVLSNVIHGMLGEKGSWRAFTHTTAPKAWRERAFEALKKVGLEHKAMERADALSGGQQQRVAIARAVVRRPKLLIADEPAASLDPTAGHDIMTLFTELCQDHKITLLFTSHDMAQTTEFADRVIALKAGKIHFDKTSQEVDQRALEETFN